MGWKQRLRAVALILLVVLIGLVITAVLFLRLPLVTTETVSFQNGDVTLAGTLALPRWHDGPYPAAVIVHGSGGMPRWPYWLYAMKLVPHGMAVLIYDKRGVGKSSGTNPQDLVSDGALIVNKAASGEMIDLLAGDALAGVEWLKSRENIDSSRIGFAGVSQAGWIMPLAASRSDDVKFIISISGPAVSVGVENLYSDLTGDNPGGPHREQPLSDEEIEQQLRNYDGPAYYDPIPVLENLKVPMLWVLGGRDRSVPTSWSVANLERLIAEKNAPFDMLILPKGNHLIRDPEKPMLWSFLTFWPEVRQWLTAQGRLHSP